MTFEELVTELRAKEVRIYDEDSSIRLQAPKGVLTPTLLETITLYSANLRYLIRLGDVRVCPARTEHRPEWRYSSDARTFVCPTCRKEEAAA